MSLPGRPYLDGLTVSRTRLRVASEAELLDWRSQGVVEVLLEAEEVCYALASDAVRGTGAVDPVTAAFARHRAAAMRRCGEAIRAMLDARDGPP